MFRWLPEIRKKKFRDFRTTLEGPVSFSAIRRNDEFRTVLAAGRVRRKLRSNRVRITYYNVVDIIVSPLTFSIFNFSNFFFFLR